MTLKAPINSPPPMYCTCSGLLGSPPCRSTVSLYPVGLGPWGLGSEENPLALATYSFESMTRTTLGYQPVGTNPSDLLEPGALTSNTARQLLSALATYNVLSSAARATELLVVPLSWVGNTAVFSVSSTVDRFRSTTETVLSFALATNKYRPLRDTQRSLGLSPTATESVNRRLRVS